MQKVTSVIGTWWRLLKRRMNNHGRCDPSESSMV
jgi:hypothetical protein